MKYRRVTALLIAVGGSLLASSCTFVQMPVKEPGVTIERITTSSGQVSYAQYYRYRKAYLLRGEITTQPRTGLPIGGHVDIAVTAPDGVNTECTTVLQKKHGRHGHKPFSIRFDELPAPGSVVVIKHHDSVDHEGCGV